MSVENQQHVWNNCIWNLCRTHEEGKDLGKPRTHWNKSEKQEKSQADNEVIRKVLHFSCLQVANHNVTSVWSDPNLATKKVNPVSYHNRALTKLSCVEIFNQVSKKLTQSTLKVWLQPLYIVIGAYPPIVPILLPQGFVIWFQNCGKCPMVGPAYLYKCPMVGFLK